MALTGEEITDEIRELVGRSGSAAMGVIDDTRAARWQNEAQQRIVEKCPGLPSRQIEDISSFNCVSDQINYSFASFCADRKMCHPLRLYYLNGKSSFELDYMPEDEFDAEYTDPTHSDYSPGQPANWTRKGTNIVIVPRASTDYAGTAGDTSGIFKFVYTAYAEDFTTNDFDGSDISNADEGLIYYGTWKAWAAIGNATKEKSWQKKWSNPSPRGNEDYGWLEKFKTLNDGMLAWDGSILFDEAL